MFGTYRFLLATLVVLSHVSGAAVLGWFAVHGFFILSGFLMTLVLHKSYGYSASGFGRFILNRALRLYPLYWAILLISVALLLSVGIEDAQLFNPKMNVPSTAKEWLANLTVIYPSFFPANGAMQVSPPTFTLTIELLFYALMALGLSRTKRLCWLWFGISILYMGTTHVLGLSVFWRYSALAAGSLPFSLGALIYHYKDRLTERPVITASATLYWLIAALTINTLYALLASGNLEGLIFSAAFYVNLGLNTLLILNLLPRLKAAKVAKLSPRDAKLNQILGDLSYPIYLLHMPAAFALSVWLLGRAEVEFDLAALWLFVATLITCVIISSALIRLIDRPVQSLRSQVRPKALIFSSKC